MPKIEIANPQPGCARYTTVNQAERFVRRGDAVLLGHILHFLQEAEKQHMRNILPHINPQPRKHSDVEVDQRPAIWWDGDDPGGMHKPGEVVS
jgi:hypothetical protein